MGKIHRYFENSISPDAIKIGEKSIKWKMLTILILHNNNVNKLFTNWKKKNNNTFEFLCNSVRKVRAWSTIFHL